MGQTIHFTLAIINMNYFCSLLQNIISTYTISMVINPAFDGDYADKHGRPYPTPRVKRFKHIFFLYDLD